MARKSSIKTLDAEIRRRVDELLKAGTFTLDQILDQLTATYPQLKPPSRSALGRYSQRFEEIGKRMRDSRATAQIWADRLGNEPQGDIGKLVMELLRTLAFDATMDLAEGEAAIKAGDLTKLALAMQRLETAGKANIQREQAMRIALSEQVEKKLTDKAAPRKLDQETLAFVRQAIRGEA